MLGQRKELTVKLESLWVLREHESGRLMTCAERADPIALFTSESQAKEHQEFYGATQDHEIVKLQDCLQ